MPEDKPRDSQTTRKKGRKRDDDTLTLTDEQRAELLAQLDKVEEALKRLDPKLLQEDQDGQ